MAFPYVIPPMRPVTQADVHGAVNALLGNPKPRPRAGMFGGGKAPRPRENLQPARETVASKVEDTARNALLALGLNKYSANMLGQRTFNFLNDLTPVGSAVSFDQARQDYNQGNYGSALGNALLGAISAVPEVGKGAGVVSHAIIAPLFHGSPHKFEKFALEKIGTGEGAQAYGHGLYFAENPAVARDYQRKLRAPSSSGTDPVSIAQRYLDDAGGDPNKAMDAIRQQIDGAWARNGTPPDTLMRAKNIINTNPGAAQGHLYEVSLDANPEDFLNWDAPLYKQSEKVQSTLGVADMSSQLADLNKQYDNALALALNGDDAAGAEAARLLREMKRYRGAEQYGRELVRGNSVFGPENAPQIAQGLKEKGIPGLKYWDGGSRSAGQGTSNYVVFDPSIIDILNRN